MRRCTRPTCLNRATATLTYVYRDQTAVLGPLAAEQVPGAHDLCAEHAERTSVPRGWEVIRLPLEGQTASSSVTPVDDLLALADAVREVGLRHDEPEPQGPPLETTRRAGHLRLLR